MKPTIEDLIKCAKRELAFRRRVYPKSVAMEKMTGAQADHELACMEEILELLEGFKQPDLLP